MNTSAWSEQIDTALVTLLENTLVLPDTEVEIFVRNPEKDLYIETYPCASVYSLYTRFDEKRHYPTQKHILSSDEVNYLTTEEDVSLPFKLNYQLDFWAKYKTDMNLMSALWLSKYYCFFNLPIIDESGVERTLFVQRRDSFTPHDYFEKRERIYHSTMTYEVWGDLDQTVPVITDTVAEVVVDLDLLEGE